jgi:hypothetical protein
MRQRVQHLNYILGVDERNVPAYLRREIDVEDKPAKEEAPNKPPPTGKEPGITSSMGARAGAESYSTSDSSMQVFLRPPLAPLSIRQRVYGSNAFTNPSIDPADDLQSRPASTCART